MSILLRPVSAGDCAKLRDWRNSPGVSRYMYSDRRIELDEHMKWFDRMLSSNTMKYWVIVVDEADVGIACIYDINRDHSRAEWAFYLADASLRGRGIGRYVEYYVVSYVFEVLKLNKLCCEVFAWNDAVVRMHEGFGFVREALFRQHIRKGEEFFDVVRLGMLCEDWEAHRRRAAQRLVSDGIEIPSVQ
jgi:UDP-4-amino-4,6-dideoxy-N-acetyl-beta-L-altrosamine N-acetyltransferase